MAGGKSFIRVEIDANEAVLNYRQLSKVFSAGKRKEFNAIGAIEANNETVSYYKRLGNNLWINPSLPTHGPGRQKTRFSDNITTGWFVSGVTGSGATLSNGAVGLAHKVLGGTITAKRAKFLTIPVIPQAHGRTVKQFIADIGKVFFAKGCVMWSKPDGTIIPAFVLKKSVTHKPWPNALPTSDSIADAFAGGAMEALIAELEKPAT